MGNNIIENKSKEFYFKYDKNLTYLKSLNDDCYGEIKLMTNEKKKNNIEILAVKIKLALTNKECEKLIQVAKIKKNLNLQTILKLKDFGYREFKEACSNIFKVYFIYEFISRRLSDELQQRKILKNYFTELELLHLIDCILSGLIYFKNNNINHEDIQPKSIFLSDEGIYKINDIQFMSENNSYNKLLMGNSDSFYIAPELLNLLKIRDFYPVFDKEKSQVFSLGITVLECATLSAVSNCYNFDSFTINQEKINLLLEKVGIIYGKNKIWILIKELLINDPLNRPNFEEVLSKISPHQIQVNKYDNREFFEQKKGEFSILSPDKTIVLSKIEKNSIIKENFILNENNKLFESKYEEKEIIPSMKHSEEVLINENKMKISTTNNNLIKKDNLMIESRKSVNEGLINENNFIANNKIIESKISNIEEQFNTITLEIENKYKEALLTSQKIEGKLNSNKWKKSRIELENENEELSLLFTNNSHLKKTNQSNNLESSYNGKKKNGNKNETIKKNKYEDFVTPNKKNDFTLNYSSHEKDEIEIFDDEGFDPNYLYNLYIQEYNKLKKLHR